MERKIVPDKPFKKIIKKIYTGDLHEVSDNAVKNINDFFQNYIANTDIRIPYSLISKIIYNDRNFYGNNIQDIINSEDLDNTVDEKLDIVDENIEILLESTDSKNLDLRKSINKIGDHIKLAIIQSHYIRKTSRSVEKEASKVVLIKINENKVKIYAEFVSILGIFTGIIVGIMGSLQSINTVFSKINSTSTGKLLVFSSLTSGCIVTLVFLLMKWISTIASQNFNRTSDNRSLPQLIKDNVVFVTFMLLMLSMTLIGASLQYKSIQKFLTWFYSNQIMAPLAVFGFPVFIVIIWTVVFIFHFCQRKSG